MIYCVFKYIVFYSMNNAVTEIPLVNIFIQSNILPTSKLT